MNAIEVKNLTKSYSGFKLDNVSFALPSGCILGLVGENGAGKSTTIKLILDMIKKDGGEVRILGRDNSDNIKIITKEDVGVVLDEVGIPELLSAKEVGNIMKGTFRNWSESDYGKNLEKLSVPLDKPFKEFSAGLSLTFSNISETPSVLSVKAPSADSRSQPSPAFIISFAAFFPRFSPLIF